MVARIELSEFRMELTFFLVVDGLSRSCFLFLFSDQPSHIHMFIRMNVMDDFLFFRDDFNSIKLNGVRFSRDELVHMDDWLD